MSKDIYAKGIVYQKVLPRLTMSSSAKGIFISNPMILIKKHMKKTKLTTDQGEDYTTGFFLDYYYIKNHYRLIASGLSRQKELDADPKVIQQLEFVEQLKTISNNGNATDEDDDSINYFLRK